jgi:hypothetical protein
VPSDTGEVAATRGLRSLGRAKTALRHRFRKRNPHDLFLNFVSPTDASRAARGAAGNRGHPDHDAMINPIRIVALLLLANILLTLITIGLVLAKNLGCS